MLDDKRIPGGMQVALGAECTLISAFLACEWGLILHVFLLR